MREVRNFNNRKLPDIFISRTTFLPVNQQNFCRELISSYQTCSIPDKSIMYRQYIEGFSVNKANFWCQEDINIFSLCYKCVSYLNAGISPGNILNLFLQLLMLI